MPSPPFVRGTGSAPCLAEETSAALRAATVGVGGLPGQEPPSLGGNRHYSSPGFYYDFIGFY